MKTAKKILKIAGISLGALIVLAVIVICCIWSKEISNLMSFKQIKERNDGHLDGAVYQMNVKGDYYLDEFIAQGGAKNDTELLAFISGKLTKGLVKMEIPESTINCSSFTASTKDGKRVFGRNYDFVKTNTCIVITKANRNRHASISTVDLEFLGIRGDLGVQGFTDKLLCLAAPYAPLDGINDAGLACGIYMSYQGGDVVVPTNQNTEKPDFTSTTMLRMFLDKATTVEEAVAIAQSYDMHDSASTSFHYMVADASGKSAILEWVAETRITDTDGSKRKLIVTYNDKDEKLGGTEAASDFQWITNFIIEPGYYDDDPEGWSIPGLDRYEMMEEELVKRNGVVQDVDDAMSILQKVGQRKIKKNPSDPWITVHSVIYNLTDKTATWVPNECFYNEPFVYELKD